MLNAPFPYYGGKSSIASEVWARFGDVANLVEPFCGSAAVLLARPGNHTGHIETVNDADGMISNFWRAVSAAPDEVAYHADWPVNENDLHARHAWLVRQKDSLQAKLEGDPDYYDAKIAGWWCWGMCCWIGSGFCSGNGPWQQLDGQLVHLGTAGQGVNRQRIRLGGFAEVGVNASDGVYEWMEQLSERLKRVRVCCGDWTRVCGPTPTFKHGMTGVFLDPPYDQTIRQADLYRIETPVSAAVREWALANGDNPLMRIALCGYEGEHTMPDTWECLAWKARGGYASQGDGSNVNATKERIWFSKACLRGDQQGSLL